MKTYIGTGMSTYIASPHYKRRLPKVGDILPCFDDGKKTPSRLYKVKVIDVVPFREGLNREFETVFHDYHEAAFFIKAPLSVAWDRAKDTDWIFDETTDYFVITTNGDEYEPYEVFARTKNGGWFSFPIKNDMTGGELDSEMEYFNAWCNSENEICRSVYEEEKDNFKI